MTSYQQITDFLAERRLAIVGVSRDPKHFSRGVFREFAKRGYDVVPVNPLIAEIEGKPCLPRLVDIQPPVQAVLMMLPPVISEDMLADCVDAGIKRIWFYRTPRRDPHTVNVLAFCEEHKIEVIVGYCPMMFLSDAGFPHGLHAGLLKLFGRFPK
jgi:predicted CoA-binding protein